MRIDIMWQISRKEKLKIEDVRHKILSSILYIKDCSTDTTEQV